MKLKIYFLPLLFFLFTITRTFAQDCSGLSFTYTTSESRCVATGSITINVSGGSGNFNFKAIGPITTPVTSSNIITGLPPGYYTVQVKDLNTGCVIEQDSALVTGSYNDPRFQLAATDVSCVGNDGSISLVNQQNGRAPFTYTIIAPSPSNIGASNATGNFSGLVAGEYSVQMQDSCGGVQVRRITIENYSWWFDSVSVVRLDCETVNVFIRVKDNHGNVNTSGTAFNGFLYGYVIDGDTTWSALNNFSVLLGTRHNLTLVVKDNCGNVHSTVWYFPLSSRPSLDPASWSNLNCNTFTGFVVGHNFSNPNFCLYNSSHVLITCNSTGVFNGLAYGNYCIEATDLCYDTVISRCFTVTRPVPSVGAVNINNLNCTGFTAMQTGQNNLTNPDYCLYNSANVQISCNTTGVFPNLTYGSYCIHTHDACTDTIITRCFNIQKPIGHLTGYSVNGSNCTSFNVHINGDSLINPIYCLYDSLGNVITCDSTGNFNGLPQGHYCVRAVSCGDTTNSICFEGSRPVPAIGPNVQIIERKCSSFSVGLTGQVNLTDPEFCLYNSNDSLISCNTDGTFFNIPYGSYCIKMHNTCYDTTIIRCFTELQPVPSLDNNMQLLVTTCSKVSFRVTGTNLYNPSYCLVNDADSILECNLTGIFNDLPYGHYCVDVHDGCIDTVMRVCQTFTPVKGITLTTSKPCTIGSTNIHVLFANSNPPYTIKVYHPNGSLVYNTTTSTNPFTILLPALPAGTQYKVIGRDSCGNSDTAMITPDANIVTRSVHVRAKCPSSIWLNGSGDLLVSCNSNYYGVMPQIIRKNSAPYAQSFSSVANNVYTFVDLEPAQYIIEYTQSTCDGKLYDTVTVPPYAYPTQGQSAVYQCDNNSFSLGADVQGGVSPYSFQIIGSMPATPSIVSAPQSSPIFNINNGAVYSLIRLRTIDACGNATLSDVSVLPLQNISIQASNTCFYQNITLTVDTIPNATYLWYRKTTPIDSVLLDSGLAFNLPFFVPEEIGQYICKVIVNNGCLVRLAYFELDGNCHGAVLPVGFQLRGRLVGLINQLFWNNPDESGIEKYLVERKRPGETGFTEIGSVLRHGGNYFFNDNSPGTGMNEYRLRIIQPAKQQFSNIVLLGSGKGTISVYPNPVKDVLHISLSSDRPTNYQIELLGANGQLIYKTEIRNVQSTMFTCPRNRSLPKGMYLLRLTDSSTGITEIRKLLFE
jgi:hypothetical protein